MKHIGAGVLFGFLLALSTGAGVAAAGGSHRLWRCLEKNVGKTVTFIDDAYLEEHVAKHGDGAHRKLLLKADVAEYKRYCLRNGEDVIGTSARYVLSAVVFLICLFTTRNYDCPRPFPSSDYRRA